MTARPVLMDLTYVTARLHAPTPTGIERVDAAFAGHFAARPEASAPPNWARAIHYGLRTPHLLLPHTAQRLVTAAASAWQPTGGVENDPALQAVARWLRGPPCPFQAILPAARRSLPDAGDRLRWRLAHDRGAVVPPHAIYLNIAQYAFEYPIFFRWLEARPDVLPVFFIHDLLPLDHPEFFRAGYQALFERRVATMARCAKAAIVSTDIVGERVADEMRRRGRSHIPIFAAPLPPPAASAAKTGSDTGEAPYFLMIGTIEPRKNHLMILQAWRALVAQCGVVPRLVLVGPRGWENEQVVDLLDRGQAIRPHVAEVSGLTTPGLAQLIAGARAVLVPSFAEGYGLPLAEALAAGTPVIASDIPVFQAVSQGRAVLLDATDGPRWRETISAFAADPSPRRDAALAAARAYEPPSWSGYFRRLEEFLETLPISGQKSDVSPLTSQSP